MPGPILGRIEMPEHDGRRAAQSDRVSLFHDREPFGSLELVGAQSGTHVVVEYLSRRSRQRMKASFLQLIEKLFERNPKGASPLRDLERRKGMNVNIRRSLAHGAAYIK